VNAESARQVAAKSHKRENSMAKSVKSKTSKISGSNKRGLKAPIKTSKLEGTKVGTPPPIGGWRLAGNHNETLLR
jgi:hypothetical protein